MKSVGSSEHGIRHLSELKLDGILVRSKRVFIKSYKYY